MIASLFLSLLLLSDTPQKPGEVVTAPWGSIELDAKRPATYRLVVTQWPDSGGLALPTPFPHLMSGVWKDAKAAAPITFEFNEDATKLAILPPVGEKKVGAEMLLQTSAKTQQFLDGRILFNAADATVVGDTAKLEKHPGNARIGFWSKVQDYVTWNYDATRWGKYQALLTYSTAAPDGAEIELEFGGEKLKGILPSTGSWYRYTTLDLGSLYLAKGGKTTLTVRCTKLTGPAAMNLKGVSLIPACEGKPPVQSVSGDITLNSRDSIVEGTVLRYEPDPKKLTLGYWVKPTDAGVWRFTVTKGGEYDVEILQGCGAGQGGSDMRLECGGQTLSFIVEDTGHFQNFKPRDIGRIKFEKAGEYELRVAPQKIAKAAAMDLREVKLIPVVK